MDANPPYLWFNPKSPLNLLFMVQKATTSTLEFVGDQPPILIVLHRSPTPILKVLQKYIHVILYVILYLLLYVFL